MAHDHHHHGESLRDYFTEQLLTLFVVGLFGFVAIRLYQTDMLQYVLAEQFRAPVLWGGTAVLVLVVVRAISVWREAGVLHAEAHDHDHDHAHDHAHHDHGPHHHHDHDHAGHDHEHHHHDHGEEDHGHSHDLAWVFARMLVLFFPVALYFIGIPNSGFSPGRLADLLGTDQVIGEDVLRDLRKNATVVKETKNPDGSIERILQAAGNTQLKEVELPDGQVKLSLVSKGETRMSFNDLNDAAYDDDKRNSLQGQITTLSGRFKRLDDKEFTLFRLKMTCCAADTVPLKVRIISTTSLSGFSDFEWVQVKGQIQFLKVVGDKQTQYIPVIVVENPKDIERIKSKNEYE